MSNKTEPGDPGKDKSRSDKPRSDKPLSPEMAAERERLLQDNPESD